MSGLPGSGKDFWLDHNLPYGAEEFDITVCSADDYFLINREYRFDATKLGEAHKACFAKFLETGSLWKLDGPRGFVVSYSQVLAVSNTNLTAWEISPYMALANYWGAEVEIVRLECPVEVCAARNSHGVPLKQIERMANNMKYNQLPKYWKLTKVPYIDSAGLSD